MHTFFWKLYQTGKYADLIVNCQGRRFDVHKAIVCSQCPFFTQACDKQEKAGQANVKVGVQSQRLGLPGKGDLGWCFMLTHSIAQSERQD